MAKETQKAQNPLILRYHRLMDAFAKSDDERDFYLDRVEGFMIYADLDKSEDELTALETELIKNGNRYCLLPKLTFYETKKFMEGFVHEKVYDIDTKEKLLDIINSKEARENFLEFIYDHLTELEKWQQYYHERSRVRIIEWLRTEEVFFVFEEDLDIAKPLVEKLKRHIFDAKVPKDVAAGRDALVTKSKTYYSNEALNPRPKRGRPPKQVAKVEVEPQLTDDMYTTIPPSIRHFLFMPDYTSTSVPFSTKFDTEAQFIASLRGTTSAKVDTKLQALSERLESLRNISSRIRGGDGIDVGEGDEKLMEALSGVEQEEKEEKPSKILQVARGFLPKKKGKDTKTTQEKLEKKRKAPVKRVTPIVKKKPKK